MKNLEKMFRDSLKNGEASPPIDAKAAISQKLTEQNYLRNDMPKGRFIFWVMSVLTFLVEKGAPKIKLGTPKNDLGAPKSKKGAPKNEKGAPNDEKGAPLGF